MAMHQGRSYMYVFTFVIYPFSSLYISTAILATYSYKILIISYIYVCSTNNVRNIAV